MTDYCSSCLYEEYDGAEEPCINCVGAKDKKPTEYFPKRPTKPMTNSDKIRSDTDEELAEMLCLVFGGSKPNEVDDGNDGSQWLEWLKAEVSG